MRLAEPVSTGCGTGNVEARKVLALHNPAPLKQVPCVALPVVLCVQAGLVIPWEEPGRS